MTPEQQAAFFKEQRIKVRRLFQKYGIDPTGGDRWRDIALALAERHEPDFSSRKRGRPREHDDDPKLILMIELLRYRDGMSITKACKAIAEKGAIKGEPKALQNRYKRLMRDRHWKSLLQIFKAMAGDRWVETLEAGIGCKKI